LSIEKLIGKRIQSYTIDSILGEGGMGTVYLGTHTLLGTRAAIKVLAPHLAALSEIRERFIQEAVIQRTLRHEGIVQVLTRIPTTK
jgi:serine/threonine-protein kinase